MKNNSLKFFSMLLIAISLISCAATPIVNQQEVFDRCTVSTSSSGTIIRSPAYDFESSYAVLLGSSISEDGIKSSYTIIVGGKLDDKDWHLFEKAESASGEALEFERGGNPKSSNSRLFGIHVPPSYLAEYLNKDLTFKVNGSGVEKEFVLPSHFIFGFLRKVKQQSILIAERYKMNLDREQKLKELNSL